MVIGSDGTLTVKEELQVQPRESKLPEIQKELASPDFVVERILRLIAEELVSMGIEMEHCQNQFFRAEQSKRWAAQTKSLQALATAVKEVDAFSKREQINFDGPKFNRVFDEILACYELAITNQLGGTSGALAQSLIREFRDLIGAHEENLRRLAK